MTQCHVSNGSLVDSWSDELGLHQEWDHHGQCTAIATWEIHEQGYTNWLPICTTHKIVLHDREDYDSEVDYRIIPHVIIEEEDELDAKVEFLFAKATQLARQSPNYVPEEERTYITPNIDDLLKKSLKDALRKK